MDKTEEINRLRAIASEIAVQQIDLIDAFKRMIKSQCPHEAQLAIAESIRSMTYAAGLVDAKIQVVNADRNRMRLGGQDYESTQLEK